MKVEPVRRAWVFFVSWPPDLSNDHHRAVRVAQHPLGDRAEKPSLHEAFPAMTHHDGIHPFFVGQKYDLLGRVPDPHPIGGFDLPCRHCQEVSGKIKRLGNSQVSVIGASPRRCCAGVHLEETTASRTRLLVPSGLRCRVESSLCGHKKAPGGVSSLQEHCSQSAVAPTRHETVPALVGVISHCWRL